MATTNDTKLVINMKPKSRNMVYHIFQIHSDNHNIILHINTESPCPINAVLMLINSMEENTEINDEEDEYDIGPANKDVFEKIPFVKKFLSENDIDFGEEEITYSDFKKIKQLVIDYITTPEKALAVIDWMQGCDFDPYFIELIDSNSKFIDYILEHSD